MTWATHLAENLRDHSHLQPGQPRFSLARIPAPRLWDSREIAIPSGSVVWAVEFSVGFRPLRAAPGPQGFPAPSSWSHSDSWDAPASCRFQLCYLPSRDIPTQPTLGDHHGREEKKKYVCMLYFCFVLLGVFVCLAMLRQTNSFDTVSRHGSYAVTFCVVRS